MDTRPQPGSRDRSTKYCIALLVAYIFSGLFPNYGEHLQNGDGNITIHATPPQAFGRHMIRNMEYDMVG